MNPENEKLRPRVEEIRRLASDGQGGLEWFEAATLAQTVLHDTVGNAHPLTATLRTALDKTDYTLARASARSVIRLFDENQLTNPRLIIAHELEGNLLDIADAQTTAAEKSKDAPEKALHLALAAFLAGAALEDALRRICDANGITYDTQRTSLSKLQSGLYQPAKLIEIINNTENKQITVWGDTRNKADHGKFSELTHSEVLGMVIGVRGFIDRHLP
jgi:hypothetical protein